jgi:hypothetical protein
MYLIILETLPAYEEDESVENNFLDGGKKTKYLQRACKQNNIKNSEVNCRPMGTQDYEPLGQWIFCCLPDGEITVFANRNTGLPDVC